MSNSISIALSAQAALRRQMEITANNVANSSTPAYKAQRMMFSEWVSKAPGVEPLSFVQDFGTARDTRQGPLTRTGNTFDLGIQGEGYFAVQTEGGVRYTRNGRLQLNAERQVVTGAGEPVLGEGQPLTIPAEAVNISIARDGTVTTEQGVAGRLAPVRFAAGAQLLPAANGLLVTDAPEEPAEGATVVQGVVEESNVQTVLEITRMMEVSNRYTAAQQMLDAEHERMKTAIEQLARVA